MPACVLFQVFSSSFRAMSGNAASWLTGCVEWRSFATLQDVVRSFLLHVLSLRDEKKLASALDKVPRVPDKTLVRTLDRLIMMHRVLGGVLDLSQAEIIAETLDSFKGVCASEGPKAHQAYAAACSAKTVAGLRLELLRLPEDAMPMKFPTYFSTSHQYLSDYHQASHSSKQNT